MKSKKINIVVGGTFHVRILFNQLNDLGYDVKIYTSTPAFKFKENKIRSKVVFIPMFFQIIKKIFNFNLRPWMKYLDQYIFDTIVSWIMRDAQILYGFAFCSLACGKKIKKMGGKYILDRACPHIDFQNSILNEESKKNGDIMFFSSGPAVIKRGVDEYNLADKIITPSTFTKKSFLAKGFDKKKIYIAPLVIENKIPHFNKRKLNNSDSLTFAFVGENILRKGLIYVVNAWKLLGNNHKHKLIIRSNSSYIYSSKLIKNSLSQKGILIKEYYKDIGNFYKEIDVLCLPSIDEGFGMVVLEAMSYGIPVIISENVGAKDFVINGVNGLIVKKQSAHDILNGMQFFINNKKEVYNYGKQAHRSYQILIKKNLYKNALKKIL